MKKTLILFALVSVAAFGQSYYVYPGIGLGSNAVYTAGSVGFGTLSWAVYGGSALGVRAVAYPGAVAAGNGAMAFSNGVAVGKFAIAGTNAVAIGHEAISGPLRGVQLGSGRNTNCLLQVYSTPVLDLSGRVPLATEYARKESDPLGYIDNKGSLLSIAANMTTKLSVLLGEVQMETRTWESTVGSNGVEIAGGPYSLISSSSTLLHGANSAGRLVYSTDGKSWSRCFVDLPYDCVLKYPATGFGGYWGAVVTDEKGKDFLVFSKNGVSFKPVDTDEASEWVCSPEMAEGGILWCVGIYTEIQHAVLFRIPLNGGAINGVQASLLTSNDRRPFKIRAAPLNRTGYVATDAVRVVWYPYSSATASVDCVYQIPSTGQLNNLNPSNAGTNPTNSVVGWKNKLVVGATPRGVRFGNSSNAWGFSTINSPISEIYCATDREDGQVFILAKGSSESSRSFFQTSDDGASWVCWRTDLPVCSSIIRRGGAFWMASDSGSLWKLTDDNVLTEVNTAAGASNLVTWTTGFVGRSPTNTLFFADVESGVLLNTNKLATVSGITALENRLTGLTTNTVFPFMMLSDDYSTNGVVRVAVSNGVFSIWGMK